MTGLLGEHCAGAGKDSNTNEHGDIETFAYELHHQREVLSAVILGGYVNLHKSDLHFTQIIIHSLRWIADKILQSGLLFSHQFSKAPTTKPHTTISTKTIVLFIF